MLSTLPVVAVDFDDILSKFHEFVPGYVERHGIKTTYESFVSYDFTVDLGITPQQNNDWVFDIVENHHHKLQPDTALISMLYELAPMVRFELVTSRCEEMAVPTHRWLYEHAPDLFSKSHFLNGMASKFPERRRSKLEVCKEVGAVAMFEDAPHHATAVATGMNIPVYLPHRPWNTEVRHGVSPHIIPVNEEVHGWGTAQKHLTRLLGR